MTFQVRKPGAGQFFISRFYGGFNFFYFSRPALHVSQNGWIQFSKAGISGIKTGRGAIFQKPVLRGFQFFQSRRFAPETAYGGFNFFKAGASRLKTAYGGFNFFQSRRFAPQNRLRRFQFFSKPALRAENPPKNTALRAVKTLFAVRCVRSKKKPYRFG